MKESQLNPKTLPEIFVQLKMPPASAKQVLVISLVMMAFQIATQIRIIGQMAAKLPVSPALNNQ